ncbi:MAG: glucuronosyltransferase, partial [Deltaproteobacteria bacterium]
PYNEHTYNAVWVGNGYFDHNFLQIASSYKEDWHFHIIGDVEKKVFAKNIFYYGEMPFTETIPYILNANLGLDNKSWKPDMESCTDSLKVLQYTYAGLPIILPNFLKSNRSSIYCYEPANPDSIHSSLSQAQNHTPGQDEKHSINSWHDLAARLAGPLWNQHLGLN